MTHLDAVIVFALAAWSVTSVVVVLAFGAFVRAGRRSWNSPYEADYFVGRSPTRSSAAGRRSA